jgi:predicted RNA binding protein YcfA (HicA-like mRNA interferase family)
VSRVRKTLDRVLRGDANANIDFAALVSLLRHLGFEERVRGSHHIFTREGFDEILNLQPKGSKAKPYQVKQVRDVLIRHDLQVNSGDDDDDSLDGDARVLET